MQLILITLLLLTPGFITLKNNNYLRFSLLIPTAKMQSVNVIEMSR